jgi:hypothetical protein
VSKVEKNKPNEKTIFHIKTFSMSNSFLFFICFT